MSGLYRRMFFPEDSMKKTAQETHQAREQALISEIYNAILLNTGADKRFHPERVIPARTTETPDWAMMEYGAGPVTYTPARRFPAHTETLPNTYMPKNEATLVRQLQHFAAEAKSLLDIAEKKGYRSHRVMKSIEKNVASAGNLEWAWNNASFLYRAFRGAVAKDDMKPVVKQVATQKRRPGGKLKNNPFV